MALEGSVGEFGLVDIFQLIAMQKKAGILTVSCKGKKDISVYFLDGAFIRAFSGDENQRFADAMISAEKVTIAQLRSALRITPKGSSVAGTFVKLHYIVKEEAIHWNKILTQDILFNLLLWKEGTYKFSQETVSNQEYETPIGVEWILMEGMRQSDEWPALLKKIPSHGGVYERVDLQETQETIEDNLPSKETGLLQFINGTRTVDGLICSAGMGAFLAYKEIAVLLQEGKIRVSAPKEAIKRGLPEISFDGMKELFCNPILINGLLVSFVILLSVWFLRPILLGDNPFSQKMQGHFQELRALSLGNKQDRVEFSLNLYYLKRNQYPETLIQLKEEGLLNQEISLDDWAYTHDRYSFRLTPLHIVK